MNESNTLIRRCVRAVVAGGKSKDDAFAICTATLQDAGLLKKGSSELTSKGQKRAKEKEQDPDHEAKMKEYEKILKSESIPSMISAYLGESTAQDSIAAYEMITSKFRVKGISANPTKGKFSFTISRVSPEKLLRFLESNGFYLKDESTSVNGAGESLRTMSIRSIVNKVKIFVDELSEDHVNVSIEA
jgi:hypothetical protein